MTVTSGSRRGALMLIVGLLVLLPLPAAVSAADDTTAPIGQATYRGLREADETLDFRFAYTDAESAVVTIEIACDGGPVASYPYATRLLIPAHDPAAGGCVGFDDHQIEGRVINAAGLSESFQLSVFIEAVVRFEYPLPARTGQPFTIRPVYSEGFVIPDDTVCRWEFRWGSDAALRDNDFDDTFGSLLFEGKAEDGYCSEWTFTLPWVPVPQYELSFRGPASSVRSGTWPDRELIHATVVGTDRRIRASNLPIAQVLPSTYTPIVGQPITYTRYLVGGATTAGQAVWTAFLGKGETPVVWERWGKSATFTITPPRTGDLFVAWSREYKGVLLGATYDPPVRQRDRTDPTTSTPRLGFDSGVGGDLMPVRISWTGKDSGWGVKSYRLERSVDGGAWKGVKLAKAKATSVTQPLARGTKYRYRVRATDKAGNVGAWRYTSTFMPRRVSDTSTSKSLTYKGAWAPIADATALGGIIHEASATGASVKLKFRGRALAWLAERGPDHGSAKVYVDGVLIKTVSLQTTSEQPARIVLRKSWTSVGDHTVRIVVIGTAGHPIVSLDGFAVLR